MLSMESFLYLNSLLKSMRTWVEETKRNIKEISKTVPILEERTDFSFLLKSSSFPEIGE